MATLIGDARGAGSRQRPRHIPGEDGLWILIFGEMTLFSVFFITYLVYRSRDVEMFNDSAMHLRQLFGVINTLFLLTSSLLVVVGMRAIRQKSRAIAPWCFVGAMVCGVGFTVMKFLEYGDKLAHNITTYTNDFWMYYYVLTGLHFFHLLMGMAVLAYITAKSRKPVLSVTEFAYVEGGACFWHLVDLLWIVLFPLLYFVR